MKTNRLAFCTCLVLSFAGCAHVASHEGKPFEATKNHEIYVRPDAPPSTQHAADELARFFNEMAGETQFHVVKDDHRGMAHAIVLGDIHDARNTYSRVHFPKLGKEGYVIVSNPKSLVIAGGEPRGVLYGVYGLLEDHLGCRWFTTDVSRIPSHPNLTIPAMHEQIVPALEYREPFVADCQDGDWCARNRTNGSSARLDEAHGGKVTYFGFVHTFDSLLPPSTYYDAHPEYYSLVKGKRLKEESQLCCTNPDVVRLVTEEVKKRMREHPEATVFSVSQNDRGNQCQCDVCQALAKREGSQMAPVLYLVNKVARAVRKEFPDKVIDTLAYQWTRKAPKHMHPEPNVIIRLCSIECCFAHPFDTCDSPENKAFVKDVEAWKKCANRLWVWNYDTSFSNYFTPFPDLQVRGPNDRFFVKNHVKGIFEEDVYSTPHGELSELSGYLNAKVLWNPNYDTDTAINEFLAGVYGAAAGPVRQYIDLLHDKVVHDDMHMNIWIGPNFPLLDGGILEKAEALWNQAEAAVANDPKTLERVKVARLSEDFAYIERGKQQGLTLFAYDAATGKASLNPEFVRRVNGFFDVALRNGVRSMNESNGDMNLYRKEWDTLLQAQSVASKPGEQIKGLEPGLSFHCYAGDWKQLPDFKGLQSVEEGVAPQVDLKTTKRTDQFGLVFDGYINVPSDGLYMFELSSNDGSKLYVGDTLLVDNDGLHQNKTKSNVIMLGKGYHAIRVEYFQAGGDRAFEVKYEGPGVARQILPENALWHRARAATK